MENKIKAKNNISWGLHQLRIEEECLSVYGKLVPLHPEASRVIWKRFRKFDISKVCSHQYVSTELSFIRNQIAALIILDSLSGHVNEEIGESLFANTRHQDLKKRKKIKTVRACRDCKLAEVILLENIIKREILSSVNSRRLFNLSVRKSLKLLVKRCIAGKL